MKEIELFVSYKIAKQLKKKGFKELCLAKYFDGYPDIPYNIGHTGNSVTFGAPLYQQVIDWFREEKVIFISIDPCIASNMADYVWGWSLQGVGIGEKQKLKKFCSKKKCITIKEPEDYLLCYEDFNYYQSMDQAIKYALKLI